MFSLFYKYQQCHPLVCLGIAPVQWRIYHVTIELMRLPNKDRLLECVGALKI